MVAKDNHPSMPSLSSPSLTTDETWRFNLLLDELLAFRVVMR